MTGQLMLWYVDQDNCVEMEQMQRLVVIIMAATKQIMLIQAQAIITAAHTYLDLIQRNNTNNGNNRNSNNNNNNGHNNVSLLSQKCCKQSKMSGDMLNKKLENVDRN